MPQSDYRLSPLLVPEGPETAVSRQLRPGVQRRLSGYKATGKLVS